MWERAISHQYGSCSQEPYILDNTELKHYFLKHRNNKSALQAYLDSMNQNPRKVIASPNEHNFDEKI